MVAFGENFGQNGGEKKVIGNGVAKLESPFSAKRPDVSTLSSPGLTCRICYHAGGEMHQFCECKGSIGSFHRKCLQSWVRAIIESKSYDPVDKEAAVVRCEICNGQFRGVYRAYKPFRKWRFPNICVVDPFFMSLFASCALIAGYSITLVMNNVEKLFPKGQQQLPSATIYLFIIILLFATFAFLTLRKSLSLYFSKFSQLNLAWHVRLTSEHHDMYVPEKDRQFLVPPPTVTERIKRKQYVAVISQQQNEGQTREGSFSVTVS